eukprot:1140238-Pleurochrysis_carterae.AAC.2
MRTGLCLRAHMNHVCACVRSASSAAWSMRNADSNSPQSTAAAHARREGSDRSACKRVAARRLAGQRMSEGRHGAAGRKTRVAAGRKTSGEKERRAR